MTTLTVSPTNDQRAQSAFSKNELVNLIKRTLSVLAYLGQVVELRVLGVNGRRIDSGYFNDWDRLAYAAYAYEGRAEGIYITLNPIVPALLARSHNRIREWARHTTSDADIAERRWIFVDFDPVRPSGISSSEEEHDAAIQRARDCQAWLQTQQIVSMLADSGNGAHLLISTKLPNTEKSRKLVNDVLQVLDGRFTDADVKVDTGMANAAHLIKLYGTLARKGDNIAERPHRRSGLLDVPDDLAPVSLVTLQGLVSELEQRRQIDAPKQQSKVDESHILIDDIKRTFDMVAYAERELGVSSVQQGDEYRLPGNQGFLINPERGCWYHHGGQQGGDALDLVGYLRFGSAWNRRDATAFQQVLREAADLVGISLPDCARARSHNTQGILSDTSSVVQIPIKPDLLDVAQLWQQKYGQNLAWDAAAGTWRRWTGTHWRAERAGETFDLMTAEVMRSAGMPVSSCGKTDGVMRFARALCRHEFSIHPMRINFKNGVLNLETLTLHKHDKEQGITTCLPYAYAPSATCSMITRFLEDTIPDSAARQAYMTHVGMALIGDTTLHKTVVLFGPSRSGKTTLLKLAQMTLGYLPGSFATATLFSGDARGANSRATWLDNAPRLVCLDEFPEESLRDEGEDLFKSMTAHGGVSMWLKYRDERAENVWTPKLMFATNNWIRYRDPSGALTRRLVILKCPNSLPDSQLDGELLYKLAPEIGAFAAECILLALEAQKHRYYPESANMREMLSDIEMYGDPVKLWLSENCSVEHGSFETSQRVYEDYCYWCIENGVNPVSRLRLRQMIVASCESVIAHKRRVVDEGTHESRPLWGFANVRLRAKEKVPEEASATDTNAPAMPSDDEAVYPPSSFFRGSVVFSSHPVPLNDVDHSEPLIVEHNVPG